MVFWVLVGCMTPISVLVSKQLPGNLPVPGLPSDFTGLWVVEHSETGQKLKEVHFVNGQKHGAYKWWYSDGQIRAEGEYQNGKIKGHYTRWWQNGQKHTEEWVAPSGEYSFSLERWQDGQVVEANSFIENNDSRLQARWHRNGDLLCSGIYRNEKPWDGTFYVHQGNKQWAIEKYIDGKKIEQ